MKYCWKTPIVKHHAWRSSSLFDLRSAKWFWFRNQNLKNHSSPIIYHVLIEPMRRHNSRMKKTANQRSKVMNEPVVAEMLRDAERWKHARTLRGPSDRCNAKSSVLYLSWSVWSLDSAWLPSMGCTSSARHIPPPEIFSRRTLPLQYLLFSASSLTSCCRHRLVGGWGEGFLTHVDVCTCRFLLTGAHARAGSHPPCFALFMMCSWWPALVITAAHPEEPPAS